MDNLCFVKVQQPDGSGDRQGQRGKALRRGGRAGDVGRDPGGDGEHPAILLRRKERIFNYSRVSTTLYVY